MDLFGGPYYIFVNPYLSTELAFAISSEIFEQKPHLKN